MISRPPIDRTGAEMDSNWQFRAPTSDEINQLLTEALGRSGMASGQRVEVNGPKWRGENSYVFQADVSSLPSPLAVKLCLDLTTRMPSPNAAREQFDALNRARRCLHNNPDYSVPAPVPLMTEHGYLVTEWIYGRSLTDLLFDVRVRPRNLLPLVSRAGTWLRHLHDCHRLPAAPIPSTHLLAGLNRTVMSAGSFFANDAVAQRAINILTQLGGYLESQPLPRAWLHGDFKPDNLFLSKQRAVGLDLALRFEDVAVMDLAPFLTRLDLICYHPRGLRLLPLRDAMAKGFIAGYVGAGPPIPSLGLTWARLLSAINIWATRLPMRSGGLKRRYANYCFGRVASRLCRDLGSLSSHGVR